MRQQHHYLAVLWVCLSVGLLFPALAGATDTLDQSQTVQDTPAVVSYDTQQGQIFTVGAGVYGSLDRVSVYLDSDTSSSYPIGAFLTISVQTVIGGLPSGKQIGSGTIPLSAIPALNSPNWVDVTIRDAVVSAGTQYAIVLQTSVWNATIIWGVAERTSYTRGTMASNYGGGWSIDGLYDFTFETYVVPDVLDQSQGTEHGGGISGVGGYPLGQTFTAGRSGKIDRVRAQVYNWDATGALVATIETLTGGYPSGTVIGQGSIPASSLPEECNFLWVNIGISGGGAAVTAGSHYAVVLDSDFGQFIWLLNNGDLYKGGAMLQYNNYGWSFYNSSDAVFETYVATPVVSAPPSPPATITPCSYGICPAVGGSVTPKDSTARLTSNVQFQELPDGTVHGILNFNDSKTGNFVLHGCTTASAACRLTVTTFACTDQHAITVAGTFTPQGETASNYQLTLSGVSDGIGTFTLTAGDYTYTLMHNGIVDVTCPQ